MTARYVIALDELDPTAVALAGGKACALASLTRAGLPIPSGAAVTTGAYGEFLAAGGLRERIALELGRKEFADMRWEELWDAALRIRNLFLTTALPPDLRESLTEGLGRRLMEVPVVVRSSAPGEDASGASFAGLHESFVNVRGAEAVLEHIRLVWASLWSDAALLYRRELGLDPERSAMAVVVQELVVGERSGVCFTVDPRDAGRGLVEAVHGLNQGLVDGSVEPDRWELDRATGQVAAHEEATRERWVSPSAGGVRVRPLPAELRQRPPLDDAGARRVYRVALQAEASFSAPQDVEWTIAGDSLACLQSRPITTGAGTDDDRAGYLSLRRTLDNLSVLRRRIEDDLLPSMAREADEMAAVQLEQLDDDVLRDEVTRRRRRYEHWVDVYSVDLIPFAHGARLFGQVYNDAVQPADPHEFTLLLASPDMVSVARNREFERLAADVRGGRDVEAVLDGFLDRYGDGSWGSATLAAQRDTVRHLVLELAGAPGERRAADRDVTELERRYFESMGDEHREHANELLSLGRASYRLRDDDNLYLGRIEGQLLRAVEVATRRGTLDGAHAARLREPLHPTVGGRPAGASPSSHDAAGGTQPAADPGAPLRARQLLGQPAGPGLAVGPARIVLGPDDLATFRADEVLVCDAIDPSMTFVVPLAAAIVERRGGMLIHGAIIAREYGVPCVTGVPGATELIATGDRVSVDGHLGIVVVG